jgi:hypothetical protein
MPETSHTALSLANQLCCHPWITNNDIIRGPHIDYTQHQYVKPTTSSCIPTTCTLNVVGWASQWRAPEVCVNRSVPCHTYSSCQNVNSWCLAVCNLLKRRAPNHAADRSVPISNPHDSECIVSTFPSLRNHIRPIQNIFHPQTHLRLSLDNRLDLHIHCPTPTDELGPATLTSKLAQSNGHQRFFPRHTVNLIQNKHQTYIHNRAHGPR